MPRKSSKNKFYTNPKLIVGVGNPGEKHLYNRHNIGFRAVDLLSKRLNISYKYDKKKAIFGKKKIKSVEVIVLKPQTFINLSGEAVLYIASFLKVNIEDIIVIYDDVNRRLGVVEEEHDLDKIEHNAIKHLVDALNNHKFTRLAAGIGPLPKATSLEDFYLENFSRKEEKKIPAILEDICSKVFKFLGIG